MSGRTALGTQAFSTNRLLFRLNVRVTRPSATRARRTAFAPGSPTRRSSIMRAIPEPSWSFSPRGYGIRFHAPVGVNPKQGALLAPNFEDGLVSPYDVADRLGEHGASGNG